MSLEVIEMMIKESLRDGEISASEKETIVNQGESYGISKETVISMIDAEIKQIQNKKIKKEIENDNQEKKEIVKKLDNLLTEYNSIEDNEKKGVISQANILIFKLKNLGEIELSKEYKKQFKNPEIEQYLWIGGILIFLITMIILASLGFLGEGIF